MDFLEKIKQQKEKEIKEMPVENLQEIKERPSLYDMIMNHPNKVHVIGEVKRASPSKGVINEEVNIVHQATTYEKSGVSAISVLTDTPFFKGSIDDLRVISQTVKTPILCKDFIFSEKQIIRAKNAGASIILLIIAALTKEELTSLFNFAHSLGLEVLVETHNAEELKIAEELGAKLIGVNNRDLRTFEVDLNTSIHLAPSKPGIVYISESGFKSPEDVKKISYYFNAVLVGETLMRSDNVEQTVKELQVKKL